MQTTRRDLFGAAASGLLLVRPETAFGSAANSAVTFGVIGVGNRGVYDATFMTQNDNARLAAVCDKYPDRLEAGRARIPGGGTVAGFLDYRELLARPGIDAVIIATPIFLHPEHFSAAVAAGKHVYCEKAAGVDIPGVKKVLAAGANATKSIFFGFQQRFSPEYLAAYARIASGEMGLMQHMMSFWILGGSFFEPGGPPLKPAGEDDMIHNWYNYQAACGDIIVEQDCHGIDVLNWYAGSRPLQASGDCGRKARHTGDVNDHYNVTYEYAGGLKGWMLAAKSPARPFRDVKEQFFGSKGKLETTRNYYSFQAPADKEPTLVKSKREITIDAIDAFVNSIVANKPLNMTKQAAETTLTAILGRMACAAKRPVTWEEMMASA